MPFKEFVVAMEKGGLRVETVEGLVKRGDRIESPDLTRSEQSITVQWEWIALRSGLDEKP